MKRSYGIGVFFLIALLSSFLLISCGGGGGGGNTGDNGGGNTNIVTSTLTLSMTGVAVGTQIGSLDISVSYPSGKVTFTSAEAGALTTGATIVPADNTSTHVVRSGLLYANGFDGGATGSVAVMKFAVTAGSTPASGDFSITQVTATDLNGAPIAGIDNNKMTFTLQNQ
jgi:hypothetical protein